MPVHGRGLVLLGVFLAAAGRGETRPFVIQILLADIVLVLFGTVHFLLLRVCPDNEGRGSTFRRHFPSVDNRPARLQMARPTTYR
jgi:hypothetical protein